MRALLATILTDEVLLNCKVHTQTVAMIGGVDVVRRVVALFSIGPNQEYLICILAFLSRVSVKQLSILTRRANTQTSFAILDAFRFVGGRSLVRPFGGSLLLLSPVLGPLPFVVLFQYSIRRQHILRILYVRMSVNVLN